MKTSEDTIAMGGEHKNVKQHNAAAEWRHVAIGGVAGIMLGASTAYAAGKLAGTDEAAEENGQAGTEAGTHGVAADTSDVAVVNQGQTFGEAFAQARAEVGPGGAFRWHGGVYSTYTKEEWDAMSPEEQRQFSHHAMNVASNAEEGSSVQVTGNANGGTDGGYHDMADAQAGPHTTEPTAEPASGQTPTANSTPDVHVVGVHDEQFEDGSVVTVGKLEGESIDRDILVVDVDRDGVFDMAMSDLNGNGQLDDGEVADISEAGIRVPNAGMDANVQTAENEIAPDMPDYMNDADVQLA